MIVWSNFILKLESISRPYRAWHLIQLLNSFKGKPRRKFDIKKNM